ncbi:MAG: hypothetical protein JWP82_1975 [Humibacillus sp.]|nr:hypothetical protein [Humibacillus sp.]
MHNIALALDGAWRVLLAGLVLGAGLPAVFALGIRSLAIGDAHAGMDSPPDTHHPSALGRVLATVCFAVVIAAIVLGITFVVASGVGKELSFAHGYPTLQDK